MYFIMAPNKSKITVELCGLAEKIVAGNSPVKDWPIVKIAVEEYQKMRETT
jgi:hypothetical protein